LFEEGGLRLPGRQGQALRAKNAGRVVALAARIRSAAKGRTARFYGTAKIYNSGPVYEEIWKRLVQPEKDRDPQKNEFGVLIKVERAEDLDGKPLEIK